MAKKPDKDRKPATIDLLLGRKPARATCVVEVDEDTEVTITFEAIGRDKFEAMLDEHTPENEEGTKEGQVEDPDTFGPAIISASAIEPELALEDVQKMWDTWNRTELNILYRTALEANTKTAVKRLGEG